MSSPSLSSLSRPSQPVTMLVLVGALVVGTALGLLGGGGTVLTVPLVSAALGLDTRHAVAMSLPMVATAAATGSVAAWRRGALHPASSLLLAITTSLAAFVAGLAARALTSTTQSILLGATLIAAAALVLRRAPVTMSRHEGESPRPLMVPLIGLAVGALTGLVGVGGGFLLVPALVAFGGHSIATAVPVSLFVIACSATTATFAYRSVAVAWPLAAVMAVAAAIGVTAGGALVRRVPSAGLQSLFAALLVAAAVYVFASL